MSTSIITLICSHIRNQKAHHRWESIFFFFFRERERREGREKNIDVREISIVCLSYVPQPGTKSAMYSCALTGIEPDTFRFAGHCSAHWAILIRAGIHAFQDGIILSSMSKPYRRDSVMEKGLARPLWFSHLTSRLSVFSWY